MRSSRPSSSDTNPDAHIIAGMKSALEGIPQLIAEVQTVTARIQKQKAKLSGEDLIAFLGDSKPRTEELLGLNIFMLAMMALLNSMGDRLEAFGITNAQIQKAGSELATCQLLLAQLRDAVTPPTPQATEPNRLFSHASVKSGVDVEKKVEKTAGMDGPK